MKKINILVFAGCNDKKLISKLSPVLDSPSVGNMYLVRNGHMEFTHPKLKQYPGLKILRKIVLIREINRVLIGIWLLLTKDIDTIMGVHFRMHCIYTYILSKIFRKRYIILLIESPRKYKHYGLLIKMLKGASLIGVRGKNSRQYLVDLGVPENKFFVPQNEYELPGFEFGKVKKQWDVIYIGNFIDEKDLPLWVNTMKEVKKTRKGLKAVMLGDGKRMGKIVEMIKEKNLEENVELVGRTPDIYKYIDRTKVLLMTSKSEGLPMVAVEAMSVRVPCVLPNVGDISDLIVSGKNGFLVDGRNPRDFAKEIVELLDNKLEYEKISENALESIQEMSKETTHESITNLWESRLKKLN